MSVLFNLEGLNNLCGPLKQGVRDEEFFSFSKAPMARGAGFVFCVGRDGQSGTGGDGEGGDDYGE
jgi:hypothetical protein